MPSTSTSSCSSGCRRSIEKRASLKLDPESLRLVEVTYDAFVHAGVNLTETDKATFEKQALAKTHLDLATVPPRYRSSYFSHIWASGYSAGYYAYLWTEMLADDAYQWFDDHGDLTRANGDRFRRMILSRGNTRDLATLYADWRGQAPSVKAMMKYRGLNTDQ